MAVDITKSQAIGIVERAKRLRIRERLKNKQIEIAIVRKGAVAVTAGALGAMTRAGWKNQIAGVPWKIPLFLVATTLEAISDSKLATAFFGGVSDATLAIYADRSISNKADNSWLVAGEGLTEIGAGGDI